ncbi:MAG: AMP-binding protein [Archaeoglobaceae archaeon]
MLWNTAKEHPEKPCVSFYEAERLRSISYSEFWNLIERISKGLIEIGVKRGDRVAILSSTRYEWELFDFAIMCAGAIVVPIHTTLSESIVRYILEDSGSKLVVVENKELERKIGDLDLEKIEIEDKRSIENLLKLGEESKVDFEKIWRSVRPDDISSIVYTSGTTGEPKGATLTHWNWRFFGLGLTIKRIFADKLVYSKIRNALGLQNIRFICSAAAELRKELAYMFNGMGIPVIEGYGMTETAAPTNLNPLKKFKPGTVGPPIPGVMEAIAEDGEILVKGENVMIGYWNKPYETQKCFTEDGWFKTGDLGDFDDEGYLIFLGRKKHIIALDTGKKVSPSRIEELLLQNPYINDALIVGGGKPYLVALIVPNFALLLDLLEKIGISYEKNKIIVSKSVSGDVEITEIPENIVENPRVLEFYSNIIKQVNENLSEEEKIRKFRLLNRTFTIERNELTPTLKKRTHVILERYRDLIDDLYSQ